MDSASTKLVNRCVSLEFHDRPADANAVWKLIEQCERVRRSRPLFLFGGIAPAVLFLALGLMILIGGQRILNRATEQWESNVSASNLAVAQAIESSIHEKLDERLTTVENAVKDVDWQSLSPEDVSKQLQDLYRDNRSLIHRWSYFDGDGNQLANYGRLSGDRVGPDSVSIGKNFAFRSWFFGGDRDGVESAEEKNKQIELFRKREGGKPSVGDPYWRRGAETYAQIAVVCPVPSRNGGPPVGLLASNFPYTDLIRLVEPLEEKQGANKRHVVIVSDKGKVIYHPQLTGADSIDGCHFERSGACHACSDP